MNFTVEETPLEGVKILTPKVFRDSRGYFTETYRLSSFKEAGINETFVQSNESFSTKDTLRGIHYQIAPQAQGKLLRVIKGSAYDVAIDLRKDSPDFGKWFSVILTGDNMKLFYIPPGFGHGFLTLSEDLLFSYMCTEEYNPKSERGILWNDPTLNINWPATSPLLSDKDKALPLFRSTNL